MIDTIKDHGLRLEFIDVNLSISHPISVQEFLHCKRHRVSSESTIGQLTMLREDHHHQVTLETSDCCMRLLIVLQQYWGT